MKGNPLTRAVLRRTLLALLRPERVMPIALHVSHHTSIPQKDKPDPSASTAASPATPSAGGKSQALQLKGKLLSVNQTFRDAKRQDGTDHLSHFAPESEHPENIPLTAGDMELLPSIWRAPDAVRKLTRELFEADLDGLDGSRYVIQVLIDANANRGNPQLWTYYRTKKTVEDRPRLALRRNPPPR